MGKVVHGTDDNMSTVGRIRRRTRYIPKYELQNPYSFNLPKANEDWTHLEDENNVVPQHGHQTRQFYQEAFQNSQNIPQELFAEEEGQEAAIHVFKHATRKHVRSYSTAYLSGNSLLDEDDLKTIFMSMTDSPTPSASTGTPPVDSPTARPAEGPTAPSTEGPTAPAAEGPTAPPAEPPTQVDRETLIKAKCGITAIERSRDILAELLTVSKSTALVNPETNQFVARDWVDNIDMAIVCPADSEQIKQRYRLALLFYEMGGSRWNPCRPRKAGISGETETKNAVVAPGQPCSRVPWLSARNECDWNGISCGDSYNGSASEQYFPVQAIDLRSSGLSGSLFDELYGFEDLKRLLLGGNGAIKGSISDNVGNLISLQELDLGGNAISGSIPPSLYSMTELLSLELNGNSLAGTLSSDIKNLTNLAFIQLQSNMFTGTIPETGLLDLRDLGMYD
jgi:hypothetical protein